MSNLNNLLNIDKHLDIPIGERFLADLETVVDLAKQKQMDVTKKDIIDGLMIYYSRSNKPGSVRRRQGRRKRYDD
jgi:hypothetical protein